MQFLFSAKGRVPRKPLVLYELVISVIGLLVHYLADPNHLLTSTHPAVLTYGLVLFWPSLALSIKRFHDIGKSGWHILLLLVPFIGPIWVGLELLFTPSAAESNMYGQPPNGTDRPVQEYTRPNTSPYFLEIATFAILPLGLLWVMALSLKSGNLFGAVTPLVLVIVTTGAFLYLRRRYFIKVVLTDDGMTLHGLLRLVTVPWENVQAIRISEESFQDSIEVHTTEGRILLPGMMIRRA
jgi:uncharacterized membrane protein YhaH (DUF805 family)